MAKNQLHVEAETIKNGKRRQITLDPIKTLRISLDVHEVESTIPCGFQQQWISATSDDGEEAGEICSGAGWGSVYGTITVGHGRGKRSFYFDARKLLEAVIEQA